LIPEPLPGPVDRQINNDELPPERPVRIHKPLFRLIEELDTYVGREEM